MLNIDLEPLKQLYEEILNTQALSEKELKELKELIDKLNDTKEEFDSSSFAILKKNKELFDKSVTILQKIDKMSNMLSHLEKQIEKEKVDFDKDIQNKLNDLMLNIKKSFKIFDDTIKLNNTIIYGKFEDTKKIIENNKKELNKLNNDLKTFLTNDTKKIEEEYTQALNNVKSNIKEKKEEFDEFMDEIKSDIKKQSLIGRFGGFVGIFVAGIVLGGLGSLYWGIPVLKHQITANKFLNKITSCDNKECRIHYAKYQYTINKNNDTLIYKLPLKSQ